MASQASTADANQDLARRVAELERELTKAHRREAAAAEVLRIIGSSPTDLQPVFDAIVANCQQLLAAHSAIVSRLVGRDLMLAAFTPVNSQADEELRRLFPTRGGPIAAAVRERTPFVIDDTETDDRLPQNERLLAHRRGYRSLLVVPMLSEGHAVGTINVTRSASGGFSEQEIRLLQTFADQAVIAIENTRLFEDVQTRTNELQEALEQQTATSSVLQVISRSQTDIEPVLNVVVESAMRLCDAYDAVILLKDGETLRMSAHFGPIPIDFIALPLNRDWVAGCSVIDSKVMHIPDLDATGSEFPLTRENAAREGFRALVAAPLLRRGTAIGTILIRRLEARPFSDKQIVLLQTFADQAVIAIENTRLFEEVQARTRELQESLEFQTASSEVLNVISRSPAQLQPVLNTIVETASRLCKADHAHVFRLQDGKYHLVAHNQIEHHIVEYLTTNPIGLDQPGSVTARARSEEHTSELQSLRHLVCRLL